MDRFFALAPAIAEASRLETCFDDAQKMLHHVAHVALLTDRLATPLVHGAAYGVFFTSTAGLLANRITNRPLQVAKLQLVHLCHVVVLRTRSGREIETDLST